MRRIKVIKKTWLVLPLLLVGLGLAGCESSFSTGFNKDLLSGLQVTNDGLSYDDAYITVDGEKTQENSFAVGDKVVMNFEGVDYYELVDGKAFPGAALLVTDLNGKEMLREDDLFAAYAETGASPEDASILTVALTIGNPMISGEKYKWQAHIWDRKSDGVIDGSMDIVVK